MTPSDHIPTLTGEKCQGCFHPLVAEVVQIRQPDRSWADSSVQRCERCKHTFGGTLADRLAYVRDVYDYKYFGDYELAPHQMDAVGEMFSIAKMVPDLLAALNEITEQLELGGSDLLGERVRLLDQARAAIAKATGGSGSTSVAAQFPPPIREAK